MAASPKGTKVFKLILVSIEQESISSADYNGFTVPQQAAAWAKHVVGTGQNRLYPFDVHF